MREVYPIGDALWQDDPARIHRSQVALSAVSLNFSQRVPHIQQAAKMSDVWPIENVWAILKQDLGKVEVNDVQKFKKGNQEILVSNLPRQRTARDL